MLKNVAYSVITYTLWLLLLIDQQCINKKKIVSNLTEHGRYACKNKISSTIFVLYSFHWTIIMYCQKQSLLDNKLASQLLTF